MAKVPVDQAPAGSALDAAVAEVQGKRIKWMEGPPSQSAWPAYLAGMMSSRDTGWREEEDWRGVPEYSTEDAAAWKLIDELHDQSVFMCLSYENDLCEWYCGLTNAIDDRTIDFEIGADTRPLAITRAYLKAKGVEEVEIA